MKEEIAAGVVFLTRLVKTCNRNLDRDEVQRFSDELSSILVLRFKDHWHSERPSRGQAYRCIRVNQFEPCDGVLMQAAHASGLNYADLMLPTELTLWMDPAHVSCRLGESDRAPPCVVAVFREGVQTSAQTLDIDGVLEKHQKRKQADHCRFVHSTSQRIHNSWSYNFASYSASFSSDRSQTNGSSGHHHHNNHNNNNMAATTVAAGSHGNRATHAVATGNSTPPTPHAWPVSNSNHDNNKSRKARLELANDPGSECSMLPPTEQGGDRDRFHWSRGSDLVKS